MTAVSGPELVAAACASGIIGSFPAHNGRSHTEFDEWLCHIEEQQQAVTRLRGEWGAAGSAAAL